MPIPTTAGRTELAPCLAKAFKNELAGLVLGMHNLLLFIDYKQNLIPPSSPDLGLHEMDS